MQDSLNTATWHKTGLNMKKKLLIEQLQGLIKTEQHKKHRRRTEIIKSQISQGLI